MSIVEMKVPVIGESITEVTLSQWLKSDGDYVELDEAICEFESDKATLEFPAEAAGKLIYVATEGDDLEIGALVAKIDTSVAKSNGSPEPAKKEAAPAPAKETAPTPAASSSSHASGHPSPAAAKIMRENDLKDVEGTGKGGRVTKEDAMKAVSSRQSAVGSHQEKESKPVPVASLPVVAATNAFSRK